MGAPASWAADIRLQFLTTLRGRPGAFELLRPFRITAVPLCVASWPDRGCCVARTSTWTWPAPPLGRQVRPVVFEELRMETDEEMSQLIDTIKVKQWAQGWAGRASMLSCRGAEGCKSSLEERMCSTVKKGTTRCLQHVKPLRRLPYHLRATCSPSLPILTGHDQGQGDQARQEGQRGRQAEGGQGRPSHERRQEGQR